MSQTRMTRVLQILVELMGGGWFRAADLEAQFAIDERTLKRDVSMLRGMGIKIDRANGSFRLPDSSLGRVRELMLESSFG